MGRTACTKPRCLNKGALYLYLQATNDSIIWRMRIACCINKAADAYSECVILIVFPLLQGLRERASLLRMYRKYLSCLRQLQTYLSQEVLQVRVCLMCLQMHTERSEIFRTSKFFLSTHVVAANNNALSYLKDQLVHNYFKTSQTH